MARVSYDGAPSVNPQTGSGDDFQHVSTSADMFGAGVGEATQKLGGAIEGASNTAYDVAMKRQGMLNETAATDAETNAISQYTAIVSGYKSKEGLAAVAGQPEAEEKIKAVRSNIAAQMPNPAALKAFNSLALRHESYALQDVSSYGTAQVKTADNKSALASLDQSVALAGSPSVATNDQRFNDALQTSDFQIARVLNNQGWGADGGTGMKQNPQTGAITFDDTPQGKQGQAVYEQMRDKAHGDAWEARVRTLADTNIDTALTTYKDNRDKMPPEAQAKIGAFLAPKARAAQVNTTAADVIANVNGSYQGSFKGGDLSDVIINQESGGNPGEKTSVDGAVGIGQIRPATFAQYAKPGEDINNPADNVAVSKRIVADYQQKYAGDPARVAVAYFSGPGNVAPAGSPTPWLHDSVDGNGKSVSAYVSDITAKADGGSDAPAYQNKAEYYRANYADILAQSDAAAEKKNPGDLAFQQSVHARTEQHMNDVIRQQGEANAADQNMLFRAAHGEFSQGKPPTSIEQLTTDPKSHAAYENMLVNNPKAAEGIEKIVMANSKGPPNGYGREFYRFYQEAMLGGADPSKYSNYVDNGKDGALSTAGFTALKDSMARLHTPEGAAEATAEREFFQRAHAQITFTNAKMGMQDPKGEAKFTQFMQAALPFIQAQIKSGKTLGDLYNPKSADYVGKNIGGFMRSQTDQVNDMINAQGTMGAHAANSGTADTSSPDGLRRSVANGTLSRQEGEAIAIQNGWIRKADNAPQVPLPEGAH